MHYSVQGNDGTAVLPLVYIPHFLKIFRGEWVNGSHEGEEHDKTKRISKVEILCKRFSSLKSMLLKYATPNASNIEYSMQA